ncbi:hypothetical protein EV421DRAFT_1906383 [Armillaria borealis]|uniref:Uncharacterized protein n=1 Tax=Armillaria borealis TaxID=47425 RepID=A0AA39J9Q3_9AGAR|nr:hypothetical protein EV421DRAFT_1906383 [Armillaria borealis]
MPRFWYWVNSLSPQNASALLSEEANPTFIDDAADKCETMCARCGGNVTKTSRKRRRANEFPLPPTTQCRLVSDEDEHEEHEEEDEDENLPPPSKPSTSNRPRPTLNIMKPMAQTPQISSANPFAQNTSTSLVNPFATKPTAVPSLQLLMEQSLKIAESMPESSSFDGGPDPDDVKRIVAGLDRILKRNELITEGLKKFVTKDTAFLMALEKKEEDSHKVIMDMLNALF